MTTSSLVPSVLPFAIDGHAYLINANYERETVQVIRQQSDTSTEPGEQSLTPLGLWRRSQESWHHGAGQDFLDGKQGDSPPDPHRFRSSKGIDPWTRGQLSLLHPTIKSWSTANTNLHLTVVYSSAASNFVLLAADGTEVYGSTLPYGLLNSLALQNGTGWSPTNATIAANSYYFDLTATAAAAVSATSPTGTSGMPVDAGRAYFVRLHTLYVSGGSARIPQVSVTWYTAAGASISTTSPVAAAGSDGGAGVVVTTTVTAPATAAFAAITVAWTTNWAIGEIHSVLDANLIANDLVVSTSQQFWLSTNINAGQAAQTVQSLATNGTVAWAALGTSGLHRHDVATATSTADVPAAPGAGQIHLVGYANGFLLAAGSITSTTGKNTLWRVDSPLSAPTLVVVKTHDNPSFAWTGIAPGRSCVYAFGNSGGFGEVYKITFDPNTGTLSTAASPATYLPDGETIHALQFYAGGIIMGTGKGVRLGQAGGDGNIDYGPLIETEWPVRCLEPQGRWCWFGWTKYDSLRSGLGRADLGYQTDNLIPAWASDLMTDDLTQGDVISCVTFAPYGYTANQRPPVRVFTVAGKGVYIEDPGDREATGTLETGRIRFSTSEPKTLRAFDLRHHALPQGNQAFVSRDLDAADSWSLVGPNSTTQGSYGVTYDELTGKFEAIEFRIALGTPLVTGADRSQSVEVTRWTAKVLPLPSTIDETFTVEIQMEATVETTAGGDHAIDVPVEVAFIKGLERSRAIVDFQLGDETHKGYVLSSKFTGDHWVSPKREYSEGLMTVTIQTARG